MSNYYKILGVQPSASSSVIKEAVERLSTKWDLDVIHGAENRKFSSTVLSAIETAKDVLMDPVKRREYDLSLQNSKEMQEQNADTDNKNLKFGEEQNKPHPTIPESVPVKKESEVAEPQSGVSNDTETITSVPSEAQEKLSSEIKLSEAESSETFFPCLDSFPGDEENVTEDLTTLREESEKSYKDPTTETKTSDAPIDSFPLQKSSEKSIPTTSQLRSVCAITRLLGSETKTVYSFGLEKEIIEIFIDGHMRARVENGVIQDVYHSDWSNSTLPNDLKLSATTVIDANGCKIKTTRVCDGQKDEIVIFKDDCVLCKARSSTVI